MIDPATLALSALLAAAPPTAEQHRAEVEQWRAQRVERLTAPHGWLSLVGLHWISPGLNLIGQGAGVDIDIGRGPATLGSLLNESGRFYFKAATAGVVAGGQELLGFDMVPSGGQGISSFEHDGLLLQLLQRGQRHALRVRDPQAPTRTGFAGIEYFDIDPSWRIEARWEAHDPVREIPIVSVLGDEEPTPNPGRAVFERDGQRYALEALVEEGTEDLFFIVYDGTSGKESYGMARFMYASPPLDGRIVLDFNRLYNPPCAFTDYSTCPLPPAQNRLKLRITAGEKAYAGASADTAPAH